MVCLNISLCAKISHFVLKYITVCSNISLCAQISHFVFKYITVCSNISLCAQISHFVRINKTLYARVVKLLHYLTSTRFLYNISQLQSLFKQENDVCNVKEYLVKHITHERISSKTHHTEQFFRFCI